MPEDARSDAHEQTRARMDVRIPGFERRSIALLNRGRRSLLVDRLASALRCNADMPPSAGAISISDRLNRGGPLNRSRTDLTHGGEPGPKSRSRPRQVLVRFMPGGARRTQTMAKETQLTIARRVASSGEAP